MLHLLKNIILILFQRIGYKNINLACVWKWHEEEFPDELKKYRKHI